MGMKTRRITPKLKNCCHLYGIFSRPARPRSTLFWVAIATQLKAFLQERDVRQGWKIYEVSLSHKSVSFVVESASCSDYIEERLLYYTLVYLRKKFPSLSAIEDELFWSSTVSIPINGLKHFENKLNQISRWNNSNVEYVVKRVLPKIQVL